VKVDGRDIARIFPRRTKATPCDADSYIAQDITRAKIERLTAYDEVHISVTFTYDRQIAESLADKLIKSGCNVKVGGPAYNDRMSPTFTPGLYLASGYTFTSRGCPNSCWFCSVKDCAHGKIIELPITEGYNILDDNILATSPEHFRAVMDMLSRQKENPVFTGGIEAKILQPWQAKMMKAVHAKRLYCAYDTPDDYEPLVYAGRILRDAGFTQGSHAACCYVLIGYHGDTFEKAEKRLYQAIDAGFVPYAMLYRDKKGETPNEWRAFQREWCAIQIVGTKMREYAKKGGKL